MFLTGTTNQSNWRACTISRPERAFHATTPHKALALKATNPQIYGVIGVKCYNLQDFDAALAAWTKAIALNPTFGPALHNIAFLYQYHLDDPKAAIPYWHRAIDAGEDTAEALSELANAYISIGNQPQASRWQAQVLERYPDSPEAQEIREMLPPPRP